MILISYILGGRLPVKFALKDYQTSVPEDTPSGSVLLTAGVNKADPVSSIKIRFNDKNASKP